MVRKSIEEQLKTIAAIKTSTGNSEAAARQMLANIAAHKAAGTKIHTPQEEQS